MKLAPTGLVVALGCAIGCTEPLSLGADPDLVWWSDHETGDVADWTTARGDLIGGNENYGGGAVAVVSGGDAASGTHYVEMTLPRHADCCDGATLMRDGRMPKHAFYSARLRFPSSAIGNPYWTVMKIVELDVGDAGPATGRFLWDVLVQPRDDGALALLLYRHPALEATSASGFEPANRPTVRGDAKLPLDRWVHVEVEIDAAIDGTGVARLWQDGVLITEWAHTPTVTDPQSTRRFTLGSISRDNPPLTLHADDAAISLRRLGPGTRFRTR